MTARIISYVETKESLQYVEAMMFVQLIHLSQPKSYEGADTPFQVQGG